MRSDHLISAKVRSFGQLDCSAEVLKVLWRLGHAAAAALVRGGAPVVRYVDVGTSLGDCALAASGLLPWGTLRGVALDADPRIIPLLRESAALNGLMSNEANASSLEARLMLVSDGSGEKQATVSLDEHIGVVADGHERERPVSIVKVRRGSLDDELSSLPGDVHFLSIHGNGFFELSVLRGARALLAAGRIRCLLVTCPVEDCAPLRELLSGFGYVAEERLDWLAASPGGVAEAAGGKICEVDLPTAHNDL